LKHSISNFDRTSHNMKSKLNHRFSYRLDFVITDLVFDDLEMGLTKQLDLQLSRQFTIRSHSFSRKGRIT